MRVLVTGGAGYIGSHVAHLLCDAGHEVTVIDLLREGGGAGNRWAVPEKARFFQGNCGDPKVLEQVFAQGTFDALLHFAAFILVDESVREPERYFENNVENAKRLFEFAIAKKVPAVIFSSTCAVYGEPEVDLIDESLPLNPMSPYGESKLRAEQALAALCEKSSSTRYVSLRYFNPAGAYPDLRVGQARPRATHLMGVAAEAAIGMRDKLYVFGNEYPTPDGTCMRDYIHIYDLAEAHVLALRYLQGGGKSDIFNVGYGKPFSVYDVINMMKRVSTPYGGIDFPLEVKGRREGDPPRLAADASKIRRVMGWKPQLESLELICESHYRWVKKRREIAQQETTT